MAIIDDYIENRAKQTPTGTSVTTTEGVDFSSQQNQPIASAQDYTKRTLQGQNPIVQNAQAQQNTASAVQKYIADRSAKNTSAQAGFDPGTLQYQRTQDRANAQAEQNILAGQNQVNELTRQTSQQALQDKAALDAGLISSLTDPRAQNYLRGVLASGGDINEAYEGMFENGVLRPEYSSGTPAQQQKKAIEDQVEVLGFTRGTPEFEAEVTRRLTVADQATQAPVTTEVQKAEKEAVQQKARTGQPLTDDEVEILSANTDVVNAAALPSNASQIQAAKADNPFVKLEDGKVYQIMDYNQQTTDRNTGAKSNRHDDWTVLKDLSTGKTVYVRDDGVMIDYKPPTPSERGKSARYENGVWVETNASTGVKTGKVYDPATGRWVRR